MGIDVERFAGGGGVEGTSVLVVAVADVVVVVVVIGETFVVSSRTGGWRRSHGWSFPAAQL